MGDSNLEPDGGGGWLFPVPTRSRVSVFSRFAASRLPVIRETAYYSICELAAVPGVRDALILVAAHLPSKREVDGPSQIPDAMQLAQAIAESEDRAGHTRTVLLGDLNMNPFEFGVAAGGGLHGVMTREIAGRERRTVRGREYRFFYNPMWRFFGDGTPGPPGTHYYRKADEECFFWNIYDQALVRPALLPRLPSNGVRILDTDGVDSLLAPGGRPDADGGSDHLPILLQLDV